MADQPPSEVMGYKVGELLGKGGFATCYKGVRKSHNNAYALKVVKTAGMKPKLAERFRLELHLHSKLRHSGIVRFFEAFTVDEHTYISLELCINGSLKDMVSRRKTLSLPEIRRFGMQLCGAMDFLHSQDIIHRDIKLANVLLDHGMNCKLADFGLAQILLVNDYEETIRRTTMCGTPNYMSPEIWSKQGHSKSADVWSFAVLLYTLLLNRMPFSDTSTNGRSHAAIAARAQAADYEWPDSAVVPAEFVELIDSIFQVDAEARPTAVDIAEASFFAMKGGIPASMDAECLVKAPAWLNRRSPREMLLSAKRVSAEEMMVECGMRRKVPLKPILQEVLRDQKQGLLPLLPLTKVFRYRSPEKEKSSDRHHHQARPYVSLIAPEEEEQTSVTALPETSVLAEFAGWLSHVLRQTAASDMSICYDNSGDPARQSPPPLLGHLKYWIPFGVGYTLRDGAGFFFAAAERDRPVRMVVGGRRAAPQDTEIYQRAAPLPQSPLRRLPFRNDRKPLPKSASVHALEKVWCCRVLEHYARHAAQKGPVPDRGSSDAVPVFVQHIGNVWAAGFAAGAGLQFHFPDRTKLLLSEDARLATYHYLPADVAAALDRNERVEPARLRPQQHVLCLRTANLLAYAETHNQLLADVLDANQLRAKIEFVRDVARMWIKYGGMGLGGERLCWSGLKWVDEQEEKPYWQSWRL